MSITRKFAFYNEDCVVSFSQEKDALLYMPLCGITRCLPSYRINRENSPECVFEYIISGHGCFQVDGLSFTPRAGDAYIAPIGSTHEYWTDPQDCWEKIWFNVQGSLVVELLKLYRLDKVYFLGQCGLEAIFTESLERMRHAPDNSHETATMVVHNLIYHLSRCWANDRIEHNPVALEMKKYIDARLHGEILIDQLAGHVELSPSRATRIFHQEWGCTPYQYFLNRKLDMAKVLLRNTRKTLKEIADELNFADAYYFSNLFKRKFSCSPKFYRLNRNCRRGTTGEELESRFPE